MQQADMKGSTRNYLPEGQLQKIHRCISKALIRTLLWPFSSLLAVGRSSFPPVVAQSDIAFGIHISLLRAFEIPLKCCF